MAAPKRPALLEAATRVEARLLQGRSCLLAYASGFGLRARACPTSRVRLPSSYPLNRRPASRGSRGRTWQHPRSKPESLALALESPRVQKLPRLRRLG